MTETTFGIKNTTWDTLEVVSAVTLAALNTRMVYKGIKKARGIRNYIKPKGDFWNSAEMYSGLLISFLVLKGAADAAKSHGWISGMKQPAIGSIHNGYGTMNYF